MLTEYLPKQVMTVTGQCS